MKPLGRQLVQTGDITTLVPAPDGNHVSLLAELKERIASA